MRLELPEEFASRMKEMLGEEYEAFLESYQLPRSYGTSGKYGENYRGGAEGAGSVCAAADSLGKGRIFLRGRGTARPVIPITRRGCITFRSPAP